jgi:hypothetical protein
LLTAARVPYGTLQCSCSLAASNCIDSTPPEQLLPLPKDMKFATFPAENSATPICHSLIFLQQQHQQQHTALARA